MKPGDIILYKVNKNTTTLFSFLVSYISRVTVGNWLINNEDSFNHSSILSDIPGMQYEVTWPMGRLSEIKWDKYDVYGCMYKNTTDSQREKILEYCKKNYKKSYDWLAIITFGLFSLKGKTVCSRFVADAYKYAGVELRKEDEKLISPNEIAYHPKTIIQQVYKTSK